VTVKLDPALSASPANLVRLGCSLMGAGKGGQAVAIVERVLEEHPDDPMWREAAQTVLSHGIPGFHRSMLADAARNDAYARAIRETVAPGDVVLDIGAGSGLLAMMAAQAGAGKVVACEAHPALAATAREVVRRNGYEGLVEIVAERSTELERSGALADGADVIVSEIFSHTLIDEGAIRSLNHGMKMLARPGARIVPASASVQVALVEYKGDVLPPLGDVEGFDLSLFGRHLPTAISVPVKSRHLHLRSSARPLFDFDFTRGEAPAERRTELVLTSQGGLVTGVVQWIALQLTGSVAFENAPGPDRRSHWPCVVYPFDAPLSTSAGDDVRIEGWHDDLRLRIWR
jgi:type II protein arginine methyltransferase